MYYIVDKNKYDEILCIVEALSISKTDNVYIVYEWKTVYGQEPFVGNMNSLYRNFSSLKSDQQWIGAVFEYWFEG